MVHDVMLQAPMLIKHITFLKLSIAAAPLISLCLKHLALAPSPKLWAC